MHPLDSRWIGYLQCLDKYLCRFAHNTWVFHWSQSKQIVEEAGQQPWKPGKTICCLSSRMLSTFKKRNNTLKVVVKNAISYSYKINLNSDRQRDIDTAERFASLLVIWKGILRRLCQVLLQHCANWIAVKGRWWETPTSRFEAVSGRTPSNWYSRSFLPSSTFN